MPRAKSDGALWLVVALMLAGFALVVLLPRGALPEPIHLLPPPPGPPGASSDPGEALHRLNRALVAVPESTIPGLLEGANHWLASRGERPCAVESADGMALVLGPGKAKQGLLAASLARCANALEHLTQSEHRGRTSPSEDRGPRRSR